MALIHIDPAFVDQVWPTVAPMLQRAIDLDPEETTIDQLLLLIRQGSTHLLVWEENDVATGACTIDFINYPNARTAHVGYMGGKGIVRENVFDLAKQWMRANGATQAQCWCKGTLQQMYEKMGMTNTHQVMRLSL